jgi:hypothetical protein
MSKRIKTLADVREFLAHKVSRREDLLAKLDRDRAAGHLTHFMRGDAMALVVAVFHADEALKFLAHVQMEAHPDGTAYTDEQKFADISTEVAFYVLNRSQSQFSEMNRSTSVSANLATDAVSDFYMEFYRGLNNG